MTGFWTKLFSSRLIEASTEEAVSVKGSNHLKKYLSNTLLMGLVYGAYSLYESHKESLTDEQVLKYLHVVFYNLTII